MLVCCSWVALPAIVAAGEGFTPLFNGRDLDGWTLLPGKAPSFTVVEGAIGFQSNHSKQGEFARFRKVEIRNLDAEPAYVLAGLAHADERCRVQAREAAVVLGAAMVGPLARTMDGNSVVARSVARQALFDIAAAASAPQLDAAKRTAVARALRDALEAKPSSTTAQYLAWLQGMLPQ